MDLLDNKYRIEQLLGEGGMGAVYKATHLGTKRTVAIKIIHPQLSRYDEFVARFRREAEAAGRLRHPNVVDVTDFGIAQTGDGPVAYLVMEYLDGCTLAEVLAEERVLPIAWVVDILEQVCSAVDEAHSQGIIHRDLKPDNIWLEPNRRGGYTVKVLDFGLVKLALPVTPNREAEQTESKTASAESDSATLVLPKADSTLLKGIPSEPATLVLRTGAKGGPREPGINGITGQGPLGTESEPRTDPQSIWETEGANALTQVGSIMGTPPYMSPEQCSGNSLDARSDIYSLGVITYRLLTGETPFKGTPKEVLSLHQTAEPPSIREKNRRVSRRMNRVVMGALEKDPSRRPQSAAGFSSALRASIESTGELLRHGIALYSEHFPTFLKISLLGYAPLMVVLAVANVGDRAISLEQRSVLWQTAFAVLVFLAMIGTNILAYFIVSAATVPVVVQLMIAPLREVRISTALKAIRRRWIAVAITSFAVIGLILFGALFLIIPGVLAAVYFSLYAPVVMIEDLSVWGTLKRAGRLVRRSWSSVVAITLLQFVLPLMVWRASITTTYTFKLDENYNPKELGFSFGMSGRSSLYQLLNIFVTPLTAIMISLLYLKTRKAGGESLRDASEQFEALDIPRSKWQARTRRRSFTSTGS